MRTWEERFWEKVSKRGPDECWEWTGAKGRKGYGVFHLRRKTPRAHRLSWTLANGEIPDGLLVCHSCDVPSCCNPGHLFLGTPKENTQDMVNKGRSTAGEKSFRAKLTARKVQAIRTIVENKFTTQRHLADLYGVTAATINDAVKGRTWRSI